MNDPLHHATSLCPDSLAFDDGEMMIRYGQMESVLSDWMSRRRPGLGRGDHVAWCPSNDFDSFLTFWGLQRIGCVACPISHRFPKSAKDAILKRIDARWLDASSEATTDPQQPQIQSEFSRDEAMPSTIILTSGSSGDPKAVVHSMAAHVVSARGASTNMPVAVGDRWLWSLPLQHVSGLSILVRCALAGATVVGLQTNAKPDAGLIRSRRITHLSVVATQLRELMESREFPSRHLKYVLLGGASVDSSLVEACRERGVRLLTTYGMTEMASQITTSTDSDDPCSSGRVLPGRKLKLSEGSEIRVSGETLCMGYYESGRLKPVVDDQGWFSTGDLGTLDSTGLLHVHGRLDNMFISGGENIHPESIESAIKNAFGVHQVVVVPTECERFGERPVAFVHGELPSDWESTLRTRLQGYEIPMAVYPMPSDALQDVKPDRQSLRMHANRLHQ